jgi:lysozyme
VGSEIDLSIATQLAERFEGFRSKPYLCSAGVPTIGYGATAYLDGRRVTLDDPPITLAQAERLLEISLRKQYAQSVMRLCPGLERNTPAFNAIVDFTFNLGAGRLQTSTLRRKINARDWEAARAELAKWVRGGGRILPGLVIRRAAEAALLPK